MQMVGIEAMTFYSSNYFLDLNTLSKARNIPIEKYNIGLGQYEIAVSPPGEDIITLGANAAHKIITTQNKSKIGLVIFATETGIDQSKAAALYIHRLLGLEENCRIIEFKQACYSATAALMLTDTWIQAHPDQKALIIAADIARYGLNSAGEPSQGSGAVAMLISTEPKIATFEAGSGIYTEEAMDFWRPNYQDEAIVDGKYSCDLYLKALELSWSNYKKNTKRNFFDHFGFLFHTPIPKLTYKALKLLSEAEKGQSHYDELASILEDAQRYSKTIGNCYTASLYLTLISLLDSRPNLAGKRLGLYSYGSGCIGEFFSMQICPDYAHYLLTSSHQEFLLGRQEVSLSEYERFYNAHPRGEPSLSFESHKTGIFRLSGIQNHVRIYEKTPHYTSN